MESVSAAVRVAQPGQAPTRESGAALVEFALIAPVLFLILAAIIDFGVVFSDYISLRQGVREGARQAAVANFGATCTLNPLTGAPSTDVKNLMCTVKNRVGLSAAKVYVKVLFDPAGSANYKVNNGVIVCAQTPITSLTGMTSPFLKGRFLRSKIQMSVEQVSGITETEGEETAPAGATWSWCTASGATP